jgi:hypothetical protein
MFFAFSDETVNLFMLKCLLTAATRFPFAAVSHEALIVQTAEFLSNKITAFDEGLLYFPLSFCSVFFVVFPSYLSLYSSSLP